VRLRVCSTALTKIAHRCLFPGLLVPRSLYYCHELTATCAMSHHEIMQMFNKGRGEDETAISGEGRRYPLQALKFPSDGSLFPSKAKKRVAKTLYYSFCALLTAKCPTKAIWSHLELQMVLPHLWLHCTVQCREAIQRLRWLRANSLLLCEQDADRGIPLNSPIILCWNQR
jgi:hypothetical protein